MSVLEPTVIVEPLEGYNAVRMAWQRRVDVGDIEAAFREVLRLLDDAEAPVHFVIDIASNPSFPLLTTIQGVLSGPFAHPALGECLVIGASDMAHVFARTLDRMSVRKPVRWFASAEYALDYLRHLQYRETLAG